MTVICASFGVATLTSLSGCATPHRLLDRRLASGCDEGNCDCGPGIRPGCRCSGGQCRAGAGGRGAGADGRVPGSLAELGVPLAKFHPVPTRPVFGVTSVASAAQPAIIEVPPGDPPPRNRNMQPEEELYPSMPDMDSTAPGPEPEEARGNSPRSKANGGKVLRTSTAAGPQRR